MRFFYLNKSEKDYWLPQLFDLLYENMRLIAPAGLPYEQERVQWIAEVSAALEKALRQIILCAIGGELAGYLQYYVRAQMLMVEEIQLRKQYHRAPLKTDFRRSAESFAPTMQFEKLEIHPVFLRFPNFYLCQNLAVPT